MQLQKANVDLEKLPHWADDGNPPEGYAGKGQEGSKTPRLAIHDAYDSLIDFLQDADITAFPSHTGEWGLFDLYKLSKLSIKGLNTSNVRYFRALSPSNESDRKLVIRAVGDKSSDPLYVELMAALTAYQLERGTKLSKMNMSRLGAEDYRTTSWSAETPGHRVVPQRHWFPESVQSLTGEELLGLFPDNERKAFLLALGRVMVGAGGAKLAEGGEVEHYYRMLPIVVGTEPGLGKSWLINRLTIALKRCGYRCTSMDPQNRKFGWTGVCRSDLAKADDMEEALDLVTNGRIKPIVTSGEVSIEEKGEHHQILRPTVALLALCNRFSTRDLYNLDPGMQDRTHLLQTRTLRELLALGDLRPQNYWKTLSENLGVSLDVLALWVLRLGFEEFVKAIGFKSDDGVYWEREQEDNLESTVETLKEGYQLKLTFSHADELLEKCLRFVGLAIACRPEGQEKMLAAAKEIPFNCSMLAPFLKFMVNSSGNLRPNDPLIKLLGLFELDIADSRTHLQYMLDEIESMSMHQPAKTVFQKLIDSLRSNKGIGYPKYMGWYAERWTTSLKRLDDRVEYSRLMLSKDSHIPENCQKTLDMIREVLYKYSEQKTQTVLIKSDEDPHAHLLD